MTLWEGRYRSSIVDEDDYLMACVRYIELNPVRAKMVSHPGYYLWSSYRERARDGKEDLLDAFPSDVTEPHEDFVTSAIPGGEWGVIRQAVQCNHVTGSGKFCAQIEKAVGRRLHQRGAG